MLHLSKGVDILKTKIQKIFDSNYFLLALTLVSFISWGIKIPEIAYAFFCVMMAVIFIFCEDLTPLTGPLLLCTCMRHETWLFKMSFLYILAPFAILMIASGIYRLIKDLKKGKKFKKGKLFLGIMLALVACLVGGAFSPHYKIFSIFVGIFLVALCYYFYFLFINTTNNKFKEYLYKVLLMVCGLALLESIVFYGNSSDILLAIKYKFLNVGWVITNSAATLYSMTAPLCLYFSLKSKRPWVHYVFFFILAVLTGLTLSRTAILVALIIFPIALIYTYLKTNDRKQFLITFLSLLGLTVIISLLLHKEIIVITKALIERGTNDSGRLDVWEFCLNRFKKYPIFGLTFIGEDGSGLNRAAMLLHNTPLQILCSTGIFGFILFIPYFYQRYKLLLTERTVYKTFALLSVLVWGLGGLFDVNFVRVFQLAIIFLIMAASERETAPEIYTLTNNKKNVILKKQKDSKNV